MIVPGGRVPKPDRPSVERDDRCQCPKKEARESYLAKSAARAEREKRELEISNARELIVTTGRQGAD